MLQKTFIQYTSVLVVSALLLTPFNGAAIAQTTTTEETADSTATASPSDISINVNASGEDQNNGDGGDDTDPSYTLTVSDTAVTVGDTVTVSWEAADAASITGDWIGLYETGAGNRSYETYQYTRSATGDYSFTLDEVGTFEFRYLRDGGYDVVATSDPITVTGSEDDDDDDDNGGDFFLEPNRDVYIVGNDADVRWSSPDDRSTFLDWIGMYRPGNSDSSYRQFEYVDIFSNVEDFSLSQAGTFEFRYFTNNSYNRVATSDLITVVPNAQTCALSNSDLSNITNYPTPAGPIVAIGDSLTTGVGASPGQNYVDELEDRFGVSIVNAGVSGDTTIDVLNRLNSDVLSLEPSLVIVFIGGNDELRRVFEELLQTAQEENLENRLLELVEDLNYDWEDVPLITREETFANLESIVTQIQSTGAATMIVGIDSPIYADVQLNDWYQTVAEETGSLFISNIYDDVFTVPRLKRDLIHPNDEGYDVFADRIGPKFACVVE